MRDDERAAIEYTDSLLDAWRAKAYLEAPAGGDEQWFLNFYRHHIGLLSDWHLNALSANRERELRRLLLEDANFRSTVGIIILGAVGVTQPIPQRLPRCTPEKREIFRHLVHRHGAEAMKRRKDRADEVQEPSEREPAPATPTRPQPPRERPTPSRWVPDPPPSRWSFLERAVEWAKDSIAAIVSPRRLVREGTEEEHAAFKACYTEHFQKLYSFAREFATTKQTDKLLVGVLQDAWERWPAATDADKRKGLNFVKPLRDRMKAAGLLPDWTSEEGAGDA